MAMCVAACSQVNAASASSQNPPIRKAIAVATAASARSRPNIAHCGLNQSSRFCSRPLSNQFIAMATATIRCAVPPFHRARAQTIISRAVAICEGRL